VEEPKAIQGQLGTQQNEWLWRTDVAWWGQVRWDVWGRQVSWPGIVPLEWR